MTIDKAIEIKQVFLEDHSDIMSCDEIAADHLSIEALKRTSFNRQSRGAIMIGHLPGETGEESEVTPMTIEEALKELDTVDHRVDIICYPEFKAAIKLGIEAMKREISYRKVIGPYSTRLLSGETEE